MSESAPRRLTAPLTEADVYSLRVGDRVLLSGVVYTARDAAHKRLADAIAANRPLPIPLDGQILYYVGPSPARPGEVIGSAGPTTATRMDSFTPALVARGLRGMIGKGSRSAEVRRSLVEYRAVYFVAVGGAAALIAACIKQSDIVAYADLATEAIYRLTVEAFPLVVANDCYGGDLYERGKRAYRRMEQPDEND